MKQASEERNGPLTIFWDHRRRISLLKSIFRRSNIPKISVKKWSAAGEKTHSMSQKTNFHSKIDLLVSKIPKFPPAARSKSAHSKSDLTSMRSSNENKHLLVITDLTIYRLFFYRLSVEKIYRLSVDNNCRMRFGNKKVWYCEVFG